MTTQTAAERIVSIHPDEHPQLFLGFLGFDFADLGPKGAVKELHNKIARTKDDRLESLANLGACHFVRNGTVSKKEFDRIYGEFLSHFKLIKDRRTHEELRQFGL